MNRAGPIQIPIYLEFDRDNPRFIVFFKSIVNRFKKVDLKKFQEVFKKVMFHFENENDKLI